MGRFTDLFLGRRKTPKPEPRPTPPVPMAAEAKAARAAAARRWEAEQEREWQERVAAAHEAAVAPFARGEICDGIGFSGAGELPTLHVTEDQWIDTFGIRRGARRL